LNHKKPQLCFSEKKSERKVVIETYVAVLKWNSTIIKPAKILAAYCSLPEHTHTYNFKYKINQEAKAALRNQNTGRKIEMKARWSEKFSTPVAKWHLLLCVII
jgi:hypothetical protein